MSNFEDRAKVLAEGLIDHYDEYVMAITRDEADEALRHVAEHIEAALTSAHAEGLQDASAPSRDIQHEPIPGKPGQFQHRCPVCNDVWNALGAPPDVYRHLLRHDCETGWTLTPIEVQ